MTTLWVVRAGRGGASIERFLDGGFIEIGFGAGKLGASAKGMSREQLADALRRAMPERKEGQHINGAGQMFRFHEEIVIGDEVITYDPSQRRYFLGAIVGGVEFVPSSNEGESSYRRKVKWTHRVDRDLLGVETRNTLGSTLTLFKPNEEAASELRAHRVAISAPVQVGSIEENATTIQADAAVLGEIGSAMEEKSNEFVEDRIAALDPYDMQDLVAGVLRAMGYKARVSPPGPDGGLDIFASPDGLGLEEPRIFVEVKHRKGTMGAPEIRSFLGGRRAGDRCLYVSTGGFTKDARAEAARAPVPITLVDLAQLRDLLTDLYEKTDPETKQLVPLKRLYWPIEPKE